jgi:hypothetical protein
LSQENDVELIMYNVNGQVVAQKEFEKTKEVLASLASEAPGFYLIRIKVRDEVIVFKALKVN